MSAARLSSTTRELKLAQDESARLSQQLQEMEARLEDAEQRVRMAQGENEVLRSQIGLLVSQEQANREMLDAMAARFVLLRNRTPRSPTEEDVL